MKHIPKIFPISLFVIIGLMFFTGAYAVSESALGDTGVVETVSAFSSDRPAGPFMDATESEIEWFESVAIWVCPLH